MAIIHFLNVKDGDCSIIKHNSDRVTVIDVCNARTSKEEEMEAILEAVSGNFGQKKRAVNPISYMHNQGIYRIFRYIQTHPDMDHMDGIKALFEIFKPLNSGILTIRRRCKIHRGPDRYTQRKIGNSTNT